MTEQSPDLAALRGTSAMIRLHNPEAAVTLIYDFDALAALESEYGTLAAMSVQIKDATFTHLPNVLAAGLRHTGDPSLMSGEALRKRLDLQDIGALGEAFGAAFVAAFGDLVTSTVDAVGEAMGAVAPSRGDDGSQPPSSTSAFGPGTSGA